MCQRVPDHTEKPDEKVDEASLLALVGVSDQGINGKKGPTIVAERERVAHQVGAIRCETRQAADLRRDTLHRLKHGMEVILLQKFSTAEIQHVSVDLSVFERSVQAVRPLLSLREIRGSLGLAKPAVIAEVHAGERQDGVQGVASAVEHLWLRRIPDGGHRLVDEPNNMVPELVRVLELDESIVEPFPFWHRRRYIRDPALGKEAADFRARETRIRIAEHMSD